MLRSTKYTSSAPGSSSEVSRNSTQPSYAAASWISRSAISIQDSTSMLPPQLGPSTTRSGPCHHQPPPGHSAGSAAKVSGSSQSPFSSP